MSSVWEDIKHRLRIEDVIAEYVDVIPAGAYYKCACPFHNEKTPSLMISPDRGVWHCFGCGAGGDVFQFVQDFENITPKESLEKLASKAGVALDKKPKVQTQELKEELTNLEKGYDLLEWTANIYHQILLKILQDRNHNVTQYCLRRGLSQEIIVQFKIGYAPSGNFLYKLAQKYNLDFTLLENVGVLRKNKFNDYRDKFADRLLIPIQNTQSKTVGFTGRVLPGDSNSDRPKYLNSSASLWFNKSELWFGLNLAKRAVFKHKKAILVEGNMDVISAFAHNLDYTIASQGTAFTSQQLRALYKVTKTIQIAFDNDNAGRIAGEKLFQEAVKFGFTVDKVIIPPEFKDLDEYLFSERYASDQELTTIPYLNFVLDQYKAELVQNNSHEKKKAIEHILSMIAHVDEITGELYLNELSSLSNVNKQTLHTIYTQFKDQIKPVDNDIEDEETGETFTPRHNDYGHIRVAFQKLLLTNINEVVLYQLFNNLQMFIVDFKGKTYEEYKTAIQSELEMMKESGQYNYIDPVLIFDSLLLFLDQNISKFILDPDLKESYQSLKSYKLGND